MHPPRLQYGGVYADADVRCIRPISKWNALHGQDADVLVGAEWLGPTGDNDSPQQVTQW
jgi:hypothetical protein